MFGPSAGSPIRCAYELCRPWACPHADQPDLRALQVGHAGRERAGGEAMVVSGRSALSLPYGSGSAPGLGQRSGPRCQAHLVVRVRRDPRSPAFQREDGHPRVARPGLADRQAVQVRCARTATSSSRISEPRSSRSRTSRTVGWTARMAMRRPVNVRAVRIIFGISDRGADVKGPRSRRRAAPRAGEVPGVLTAAGAYLFAVWPGHPLKYRRILCQEIGRNTVLVEYLCALRTRPFLRICLMAAVPGRARAILGSDSYTASHDNRVSYQSRQKTCPTHSA
jgi:hypothetical protein